MHYKIVYRRVNTPDDNIILVFYISKILLGVVKNVFYVIRQRIAVAVVIRQMVHGHYGGTEYSVNRGDEVVDLLFSPFKIRTVKPDIGTVYVDGLYQPVQEFQLFLKKLIYLFLICRNTRKNLI